MRDRLLLPVLLVVVLSTACGDTTPDARAVDRIEDRIEDRIDDRIEAADVSVTASDETCDGAGLGALPEIRRLPPLTSADVDRYLRVMRDAATRRTRLTPEERDVLARGDALQRRALTEGLPATQEAAVAANALMSRADTLRRHLDVVVVREQGGSAACWALLRDRVESIVPRADGTSGIYGDESDAVGQADPDDREAPSTEDAEDAEIARRLGAIRAADSVVVAAQRVAIGEALAKVRH
ncbi:MAG: hypothetical protein ACXWZS_07415 [Gemmatirosa sp.]